MPSSYMPISNTKNGCQIAVSIVRNCANDNAKCQTFQKWKKYVPVSIKNMPGTNKIDSCDNNMCLDLTEVRDTFGQTDNAV